MIKRRALLKGGIAGAIALNWHLPGLAQSSLSSAELSPGIHLIQGAGCNVVLADLGDELLLIDGGLASSADMLLQEIAGLAPGKSITTLFNTNWRAEHCGLNYELGKDCAILAHENTRLWQTADPYVEWENKYYQPMPEAAQANQGFYTGNTIQLGHEELTYRHIPKAHTDGDICLHFREADVLVLSDLLVVNRFPIIDYSTGGWIRGFRDASRMLLEIAGEDTVLTPAQGPVQNRSALERQAGMLAEAWDAVVAAFQNGFSLEEFQASNPMAAYTGERGDPTLFLQQVYRSTWYHVTERAVPNVI